MSPSTPAPKILTLVGNYFFQLSILLFAPSFILSKTFFGGCQQWWNGLALPFKSGLLFIAKAVFSYPFRSPARPQKFFFEYEENDLLKEWMFVSERNFKFRPLVREIKDQPSPENRPNILLASPLPSSLSGLTYIFFKRHSNVTRCLPYIFFKRPSNVTRGSFFLSTTRTKF